MPWAERNQARDFQPGHSAAPLRESRRAHFAGLGVYRWCGKGSEPSRPSGMAVGKAAGDLAIPFGLLIYKDVGREPDANPSSSSG
jgi:hypothetical protein